MVQADKFRNADMQPVVLMTVFGLAVAMCGSAAYASILQHQAEKYLADSQQDFVSIRNALQKEANAWKKQAESLHAELKHIKANLGPALHEAHKEHQDAAWLRTRWHDEVEASGRHPYAEITGASAQQLPRRYGSIPEKTIWLYWYHPLTCPNSQLCVLNPKMQLLSESVLRNKGHFHVEFVHKDQVEEFISDVELPVRWKALSPQLQQGAVINALLARYGGVALDLCTCLLRPLDDYWDEMVARGASFRGYLFRLNGKPWRRAEAVADWFLMGRREGIFSAAVRSQVITMGDAVEPHSRSKVRNVFGDDILFPILSMFDYDLPRCGDDASVGVHRDLCPEAGQIPWWTGISGPTRNDTRILLRDPRDGPLLPFAHLGMDEWKVTGTEMPHHDPNSFIWQTVSGASMNDVRCKTPKECWEEYVMKPFHEKPKPGEAPALSFVKLTQCEEVETQSREALLAATDTFFYNLLRLSGRSDTT